MIFNKPWGNYLLDTIVETPPPASISFWPETIAWQIILLLIMLLSLKKGLQAWQYYQVNAYRREALRWLKLCSFTNEKEIRQLPALLRKTALIANQVSQKYTQKSHDSTSSNIHKQAISQLNGKAWLLWLDEHCSKTQFNREGNSGSTSPFSCESLLNQLAYIPHLNLDNPEFIRGVKRLSQQIELWIQHHQIQVEKSPVNKGSKI